MDTHSTRTGIRNGRKRRLVQVFRLTVYGLLLSILLAIAAFRFRGPLKRLFVSEETEYAGLAQEVVSAPDAPTKKKRAATIIARYRRSDNSQARAWITWALAEEMEAVRRPVRRVAASAPAPTTPEEILRAELSAIEALGNADEKIARLNALLECRAEDEALEIRRLNALTRAKLIRANAEPAEKIRHADILIRSHQADADPYLREMALWAVVVKANQTSNVDDKIRLYDEVIAVESPAASPFLQKLVADALVGKARLSVADQAEALSLYSRVIDSYGDSPDAALRKVVARAIKSRDKLIATP